MDDKADGKGCPPSGQGDAAPLGAGQGVSVGFEKFVEGAASGLMTIEKRWNNISIRKKLGWAEGYLQGWFEVGVIHHFRTSGNDLCKVMTRCKARAVVHEDAEVLGLDPIRQGGADELVYYNQFSMFVGVVDFIELVDKRAVSSECRINQIEDGITEISYAGAFENFNELPLKIISVLPNRELASLFAPRLTLFPEKGGNKMIKRVTQISDDVANGEVGRDDEFVRFYFDNLFPVRSIRLLDGHPNVIVDVLPHRPFEHLDVVRGPMGF